MSASWPRTVCALGSRLKPWYKRPVRAPRWLFCACLALAGCSSPPGDNGETPFDWQVALADLDDAMLAVCGSGSQLIAVGGSADRARVLEHQGDEWTAPLLPAGAGVLWWCWSASDGTTFAVGERGTLLRRDATGWLSINTRGHIADDAILYGVWGTSASDVWLVGGRSVGPTTQAVIAHYDGGRVSAVSTTGLPEKVLFKVWGSPGADVWAVGDGGTALRYAGSTWTPVSTPTDARLIAVWGTSSSEVFAVGGTGTGVVLRWNGLAWTELVTSAEELSGVWTAPNRPLYVGGNRGYLARYERNTDGEIDPALFTATIPKSDVCLHSIFGYGAGVVAVGSDLIGGNAAQWRGAVLAHGDPLADSITYAPLPDAGMPDASVPDATPGDANTVDADPSLPGKGEECNDQPPFCADGLECWGLMTTGIFLCTESCSDASECTEYGPMACCKRPGIQTIQTVCMAGMYAECSDQI